MITDMTSAPALTGKPIAPWASAPRGRSVQHATSCAVLVDFDNFFPGDLGTAAELQQSLDRMVDLALSIRSDVTDVSIRLYGGWLQDGILTNRASQLQTLLGPPASSAPHPNLPAALRLNVTLVTTLQALPELQWRHTYRSRLGLPRLRLVDSPRPEGCAEGESCPIDLMQRISRRPDRTCHVAGCAVRNDEAFLIREQKMVDSLITCDCLTLAGAEALVVVLSNDLDALPGVAIAASWPATGCTVALVRSNQKPVELYEQELAELGVRLIQWVEI
jgi:hypothetical protein